MRVSEAIKEMSKMYLQRIIDSFTKDFPRGIDEERSREIILRNVDELTDPDRVEAALSTDASFADRLLYSLVLEALVLSPDGAANEESVARGSTPILRTLLKGAILVPEEYDATKKKIFKRVQTRSGAPDE